MALSKVKFFIQDAKSGQYIEATPFQLKERQLFYKIEESISSSDKTETIFNIYENKVGRLKIGSNSPFELKNFPVNIKSYFEEESFPEAPLA